MIHHHALEHSSKVFSSIPKQTNSNLLFSISFRLDESSAYIYQLEPAPTQILAIPDKKLSQPIVLDHMSSGSLLTEPSEQDLNVLITQSKIQDVPSMGSRKSSANQTQKGSTGTGGGGGALGTLVGRQLPTPASNFEYKKAFRLVIQNGMTKDQTEDFLQFRQFYCLMWGNIVTVFRLLEKLMYDYAVPIAFINGEK